VFKLYQFLELLDKTNSDKISTLLLKRDLQMNDRMVQKYLSAPVPIE